MLVLENKSIADRKKRKRRGGGGVEEKEKKKSRAKIRKNKKIKAERTGEKIRKIKGNKKAKLNNKK